MNSHAQNVSDLQHVNESAAAAVKALEAVTKSVEGSRTQAVKIWGEGNPEAADLFGRLDLAASHLENARTLLTAGGIAAFNAGVILERLDQAR